MSPYVCFQLASLNWADQESSSPQVDVAQQSCSPGSLGSWRLRLRDAAESPRLVPPRQFTNAATGL